MADLNFTKKEGRGEGAEVIASYEVKNYDVEILIEALRENADLAALIQGTSLPVIIRNAYPDGFNGDALECLKGISSGGGAGLGMQERAVKAWAFDKEVTGLKGLSGQALIDAAIAKGYVPKTKKPVKKPVKKAVATVTFGPKRIAWEQMSRAYEARLRRGEITEAEYERLMDELGEMPEKTE